MNFDLSFILFVIISLFIATAILVVAGLFLKTDKQKTTFLKIFAITTVVLHFSNIYVNFFAHGEAEIFESQLLPIYPCNVAMWIIVILAFMKNKSRKAFALLAEFTFYLSILGGLIGLVLNNAYSRHGSLLDWDVLHTLLSHISLMISGAYLLVGGFIKIRVKNIISAFLGLAILLLDGGIIIALFKLAKLKAPNCMFLLRPEIESAPWLNKWTVSISAILLIFIITAIYEQIALKPQDRWYNKLKNKYKKED